MVLCLFVYKQGQGQQRLIHPTTTEEVLWCFVFKWFLLPILVPRSTSLAS